ncbi:MAG TPA: hypothetical protein VGO70_07815 [Arsenicitalea sp.]|jgi:hypothetical protein|nr:hypothetical protein [Arsenicitalea sp.]
MNNVRLQLRASLLAFAIFAVSSVLLFVLAQGIRNIAAGLPMPRRLPAFSPLDAISAVLDMRPFIVLGAGILLAAALALLVRSTLLDRGLQMLASMLALVLASIIGIIVGFAVLLAISEHRLVIPPGATRAAICFAVVLVASFATIEGLRRSLLLRSFMVLALVVSAPLVLIYGM